MARVNTTIFERDIRYFRNFGTINLQGDTASSRLYILAIFVPICLQTASCLTDTYLVFGDIDRMVDNMAISLTFVYGIFKFGVLFSIKGQIVGLVEGFEHVETHVKVLFGPGEYEKSLMGRIADRFDKAASMYVKFVFLVAVSWYLQPLIQMKYMLPFLGTRYPYDLEKLHWYIPTYAFQVYTNFYVLLYVAAIDLFVVKIVCITCEHFDVLRHSLNHINESLADEADDEMVYKRLVKCVKYHQELFRISNVLKSCLSSVLMSQFTYNLTTMCFAIMALAKKDVIDGSVLNLVMYLYLANVEIFVFCWFSHQLTSYSESVSDGAYFSLWASSGSKVRRALRFVMFRSSEPVNLMAAGIFPVSVVSYVTIMRTSFSYYTILKQLKEQ